MKRMRLTQHRLLACLAQHDVDIVIEGEAANLGYIALVHFPRTLLRL